MIAYVIPNRNGSYDQARKIGASIAYQCVDDPIGHNDGGTTHLEHVSFGTYINSFKGYNSIFNDSTIKINSIKICHVSYLNILNGAPLNGYYIRSFFYINGNFYYSPLITNPMSDYQYFEYTWNKSPTTNQNWDPSIINNLEFGIVLSTNNSSQKGGAFCTQIYLEIAYNESDLTNGFFLLNPSI